MGASLSLFLAGGAAGLAVAIVGGFLEYRLSLRSGARGPQQGLPGCLLYVAGGLGLAGIIALGASLLLSGGLLPALILGAGVLGGFYLGFGALFLLWLILDR